MYEVCQINMDPKYSKILTIDRLLAKFDGNANAIKYLPNEPSTHVTL
jgi:hypothetical protein